MENKRTKIFTAKNISVFEACGHKFYQIDIESEYEQPFMIAPIKGKHDLESCDNCQEEFTELEEWFTKKFKGTGEKRGFPFCCKAHKNLLKLKGFTLASFSNMPKNVALKIIYTKCHIINNHDKGDWYKDITDYIEYGIESFGKMPKGYGEPLYRSNYLGFLEELIKRSEVLPKAKKDRLYEYLNMYVTSNPTHSSDLRELIEVYDKWLKIFPFEISYFASLKESYTQQIRILKGKSDYNKYLNISKLKMHTKSSLIEQLINLTDDLLKKVNGLKLFENGKLNNPRQIRLELVLAERRTELKIGYKANSKNEQVAFRQALKKWFEDEKRFLLEIEPLLTEPLPKLDDKNRTKKLINEYFDGMHLNKWKYAFSSENDYNKFANVLISFFEGKAYQLPTKIKNKGRCKTKLAETLGEIYRELSEDNLNTNEDYFKILRVLSAFNGMTKSDLYKALTR